MRQVFFSFHYSRDVWRASQVRNMGIDTARHLFKLMNLPWQEVVLCGHRISISCFEPLGVKSLDKQYAARAIEEWLCFEAENIENAKSLEELI